jgi:hypothetical protein
MEDQAGLAAALVISTKKSGTPLSVPLAPYVFSVTE